MTSTEERAPSATADRHDMHHLGPALELSDVRRSFRTRAGTVHAVDGIDLTIRRGEIVALLGPNGAGKTTTIDMLLGFIEPTAGTVRVLGESPAVAASSGSVSAVLQNGGLLGDLTVVETLRMIASLFGRTALERVPELMDHAGIARLSGRRVSKCSGGEQQRVKFALALVADPEVLVLDEPTVGMDVDARRRFWEVMRADAEAGRTIVFATHDLSEVEQFARRTIVMNHGRVVADAPTARLRAGVGPRTVAATLPADAERSTALLHELGSVAEVRDLRVEAGRLTLRTTSSDTVAGALLAGGARELEIVAPDLEATFTALTKDRS